MSARYPRFLSDGNPLASECTLHANCASHPQLSYFWQSHTEEDGAAAQHYVMKKKKHGASRDERGSRMIGAAAGSFCFICSLCSLKNLFFREE
jgi:hypothetical protein